MLRLTPSVAQVLSHGNLFLQQLYTNLALLRMFIRTTPDLYESYADHEV